MRAARAIALALVLAAVGLGGCGPSGPCTPTTTTAADADRLDLTEVSQSSTLSAVLTITESAAPIPGKSLRFSVRDGSSEVYATDGSTGDDGGARVDLKRVDPGALQGIVRGDSFRASFGGDATYCSSADDAAFRIAKAPAGITVGTP